MSDRLKQLHKLHAADPADPDLPYMIALEHAKAGTLDEALVWLDHALARDEHYHYAYYQKAKLLGELGRPDAARAVIDLGLAKARDASHAKAASELEALRDTLDD